MLDCVSACYGGKIGSPIIIRTITTVETNQISTLKILNSCEAFQWQTHYRQTHKSLEYKVIYVSEDHIALPLRVITKIISFLRAGFDLFQPY